MGATRSDLNPLGLFELLNYPDISGIKGSGLGGTSLINANVAIVPDREVFEQFHWPASIAYDALLPYYQRARQALAANPHPHALELAKEFSGTSALPIAVIVKHNNPCGVAASEDLLEAYRMAKAANFDHGVSVEN